MSDRPLLQALIIWIIQKCDLVPGKMNNRTGDSNSRTAQYAHMHQSVCDINTLSQHICTLYILLKENPMKG